MTSSVSSSNDSSNPYASLGLAIQSQSGTSSSGSTSGNSNGTLNQADFLKLLTTQLQNQDPTKPMDNTAFVAQMAQFSSVQGIDDLNKTVQGFQSTLQANQVIQAASLVGKAAMVKGDTARMYQTTSSDGKTTKPSGILGAVDVPTGATKMTVKIADATGKVVKSIDVPVNSGNSRASFSWDGMLADGTAAPAGNYTVSANATVSGKGQAAQTYVGAVIQSVGVSSNGPQINLDGLGTAKLSDIVGILN